MDILHMSPHFACRTFLPTYHADGAFIAVLGERLHGILHVHAPRIKGGPHLIGIPDSKNGTVNPLPTHMVLVYMSPHVVLVPQLLVAGRAPIRDGRDDV